MTRILSALLFVMTIQLAALPAHATSPEKRDAVLRLVETLGVVDLNHLVTETFMNSVRTAAYDENPAISSKAIEIAQEELLIALANNQAALIEMFVEMYDRNFTLSEIQDMNQFYRTSTGQKLVRISPVLNEECLALSQSMAALILNEVAPVVKRRLRQEQAH